MIFLVTGFAKCFISNLHSRHIRIFALSISFILADGCWFRSLGIDIAENKTGLDPSISVAPCTVGGCEQGMFFIMMDIGAVYFNSMFPAPISIKTKESQLGYPRLIFGEQRETTCFLVWRN